MQALPTFYKGYHFRSRLEARWAVFFDALGIEWEYEPEAFDVGGVGYLPDFKIYGDGMYAGLSTFVEVKPHGGDFEKARSFAKTTCSIVLCDGPPERERYEWAFRQGSISFGFWRSCDPIVTRAIAAARSARFEQNRSAYESLL